MYLLYQDRNEEFTEIVLGMTGLPSTIQGLEATSENLATLKGDRILINRVLALEQQGGSEDAAPGSYFKLWKELSKTLTAQPSVIGRPGPLSFATQAAALNYQWESVRKEIADIDTPEYYFGDRTLIPSGLSGTDVFFSDPECLHFWGKTEIPDPRWQLLPRAFVVKRPPGVLVAATVALGSVMVNRLDREPLTDAMSERICGYAQNMARQWNAGISECLFFVDGNRVTFGMHTASLMISSKLDAFRSFIDSSVRRWSYAVAA